MDSVIAFHLFVFSTGNPCELCPRFSVSKDETERGSSLMEVSVVGKVDFKQVFYVLSGANRTNTKRNTKRITDNVLGCLGWLSKISKDK